jgi:hypothetical protein
MAFTSASNNVIELRCRGLGDVLAARRGLFIVFDQNLIESFSRMRSMPGALKGWALGASLRTS